MLQPATGVFLRLNAELAKARETLRVKEQNHKHLEDLISKVIKFCEAWATLPRSERVRLMYTTGIQYLNGAEFVTEIILQILGGSEIDPKWLPAHFMEE